MPISLIIYWLLVRLRYVTAAKLWLVAASFYFYGYWDVRYVPLLAASLLFNYGAGRWLASSGQAASGQAAQPDGSKRRRTSQGTRRLVLGLAIAANIALLGVFKYTDFFIENLNALLQTNWQLLGIILPIGISFYTFSQITYLWTATKGKCGRTACSTIRCSLPSSRS